MRRDLALQILPEVCHRSVFSSLSLSRRMAVRPVGLGASPPPTSYASVSCVCVAASGRLWRDFGKNNFSRFVIFWFFKSLGESSPSAPGLITHIERTRPSFLHDKNMTDEEGSDGPAQVRVRVGVCMFPPVSA